VKVNIPCELEVNENHVRFKVGGVLVFANYAHHLERWQKDMVKATVAAFGQANKDLSETLVR
jgi:hypothetical protein